MEHGAPRTIRVDNGPEFISKTFDRWAYSNGVTLGCSRPGKLVQHAFVESFNGKLRDECLNEHVFTSLTEARRIAESWRIDYNTVRPHSSLGGLPPSVFASRPLTRGHFEAGSNL
jgi:putative transposase